MSDWFYEDIRTEQSGECISEKSEKTNVVRQPLVPIPDPLIIDVSDEEESADKKLRVKKEKRNIRLRVNAGNNHPCECAVLDSFVEGINQ